MNKKKANLKPYIYSAPSLILIALVVVFPILYTGYISLTNMNIYHWFDFSIIGLDNYKEALLDLDSGFLRAILTTVVWTVVNMVTQVIIAFCLAILLNIKGLRLRKLYKTVLMFPWAMPGYVSILLWKTGMFNSEFGLLNQWMEQLGHQTVKWLSNDISAFISCTVVNLWLALPFMITMMDGALQSVDSTYYESADLEGANWLQKSIHITVPMIKQIVAPAIIITIFTTFKQFDIIYLLTQQPGAKTGADIHTVITYAHENAFVTNNYGFSSAISIIIFAILIIFNLSFNKGSKGDRIWEKEKRML